jgi:RNA polymerase sigma-70 factor (ECF subfamily)
MEPFQPDLDVRVRRLLTAGDPSSAAELAIRELGPPVIRFVRSSLRDEELAADAFSEFAEDLWKGLSSFRGDASVRTWAFRVAWHAVLRVRNDAWQRRRTPISQGPASALANRMLTATPIVLERQARALDSVRARLSIEEQSLLALRVDQELSWAEVAEVLASEGEQVQVDALMKRFQRLKERIAVLAREDGLMECPRPPAAADGSRLPQPARFGGPRISPRAKDRLPAAGRYRWRGRDVHLARNTGRKDGHEERTETGSDCDAPPGSGRHPGGRRERLHRSDAAEGGFLVAGHDRRCDRGACPAGGGRAGSGEHGAR